VVADELPVMKTGGKNMILIKVTYDAYNQEFRLLDPKLARLFVDGETYVLTTDFLPESSDDQGQYVDFSQADIGHA
jgi:hypothetical protein